MAKNVIDEGLNDSEETQKVAPTKSKSLILNEGDILSVSQVGDGKIVLSISSQPSEEKPQYSAEDSEGSYRVR